ncbi:hypothetical protein HPB47_020741 [Ixodes persulcatus]|uniref:Uncharacterized protein n=1 Tax=Ixodes persulcatus TaxID=34615 RepID=A0AC60QHU2_IXOPE|nr:hypothetical protein HPB47_020741 [Ixodes persulcatus]
MFAKSSLFFVQALLFPFLGSPVWHSTCTAIKQIGTFQLIDKNDRALPIVTVEEQHHPVFSGSVTSTSATAIKAPLHQFVFIGHGETDRSMFAKSSLFFVQLSPFWIALLPPLQQHILWTKTMLHQQPYRPWKSWYFSYINPSKGSKTVSWGLTKDNGIPAQVPSLVTELH